MNYKDLKIKLIKIKMSIEKLDEQFFNDKDLSKNEINNALIQYIIFFEELEDILKENELKSVNKYRKQLNIINDYLVELENIIRF